MENARQDRRMGTISHKENREGLSEKDGIWREHSMKGEGGRWNYLEKQIPERTEDGQALKQDMFVLFKEQGMAKWSMWF